MFLHFLLAYLMPGIGDSWNDRHKWNNCQQISANFSNCDEVYFQKRIISKSGECALKKNSSTIVFPYCDINQLKTFKMSGPSQ